MAKNHINTINISGLSVNSGVPRAKLSMSVTKKTGKVLDYTERKKAINAMEKATQALKDVFSDAESL